MQEPLESTPTQGPQAAPEVSRPDEIVAARAAALAAEGGTQGPLREIAHAFRLNAEALHTLRQMQADLARSVQRGDRSELVLQSTRALNDTFRDLSGVQRELLTRLNQARDRGAGRGPLIPLMLLGLLVVLLAGIYVILETVERKSAAQPAVDVANLAQRERDAWKEGRREGAQGTERELRRLQEAADEAKARAQKLQNDLDAKAERLAEIDRNKRTVEMERDEFAGQVRKAQGEMMAKQLLEEEVGSLRLQLEAANRAAAKAQHEADLERSKSAYLRERMADYGMGIPADDPPWRPGVPAGAAPGPVAASRSRAEVKARDEKSKLLNLLVAGRKKMGLPVDDLVEPETRPLPAVSDPGKDAPAATPDVRTRPDVRPPPTVSPSVRTPDASLGGAAFGGDVPAQDRPRLPLPPTGRIDSNDRSVQQVQEHLNGLLARGGSGSSGWRISRIGGVAGDRLGSVTMVRTDASGRMLESIQARDVRIAIDRQQRLVRFTFRGGERTDRGSQAPLPPAGLPLVVAQGRDALEWNASPLRQIQRR